MTTSASPTLTRVLGPWMATGIVVGTVIGSGVFKKGQNVAERVPEFGLAAMVWILGGVLAMLGALSLAEVATRMPRAGGNYAFLKDAYGRLFGFLWGWVEFWIIRSASIAALATMFSEGLHDILRRTITEDGHELLGFWPRQAVCVVTILVLSTINALGTRLGGGFQLTLTIIKVGSILGIIALPVLVLAFAPNHTHAPTTAYLAPIWPSDWTKVDLGKFGAALVGVLWAYHGWMNIGPVAEEVRNPRRNIPFALVGGVILLIGLYLGANIAYYLVIPRDEMAQLKNTAVVTEFCYRLLGPIGAVIASGILMTSVFGSLNGNLLVGPRLLFAMARDRLAPAALEKVSAKTQTPVLATVVLAGWSCLLIVGFGMLSQTHLPPLDLGFASIDVNLPANKSPFDTITDFAMFGAVSFETLVIASLFVLRARPEPVEVERSYRCPGYPIVPAVYVLIMAAVLMNMFSEPDQRTGSLIGVGFILVGAVVYGLLFATKVAPHSSSGITSA